MIAALTRSPAWHLPASGFEVISIDRPEAFDPAVSLKKHEAVLIDAREIRFAVDILRRIRSAAPTAVYLMPAFLHNDMPVQDPYLQALADGTADTSELPILFTRIQSIQESISRFRDITQATPEATVTLQALRFILSRSREMKPVILPKSRFGYVYPLITSHFTDRDDPRVFRILDLIHEHKAAETQFLDRQRLCPHCYAAFINLKELCPKCRNANLEADDLIHHFPCGHVAPEAAYQREDQRVCPKCRKLLRHIGMDYDKPSIIYTCRSCRETFQEPEVWGSCFYCEHTTPLQELIVRDIFTYTPSQTTLNIALSGLQISLGDILRDKLRLVEYGTFQTMLAFEYEREKRYKRPNSLLYVQIDNFPDLSLRFGEKRDDIALEMAKIIRETLRDSDILSIINESAFAALLPETPLENIQGTLERLQNRLDSLFASNFQDLKVKLGVNAYSLEEWTRDRGNHG